MQLVSPDCAACEPRPLILPILMFTMMTLVLTLTILTLTLILGRLTQTTFALNLVALGPNPNPNPNPTFALINLVALGLIHPLCHNHISQPLRPPSHIAAPSTSLPYRSTQA